MDNEYQILLKAGVIACYKNKVLLIRELNHRTNIYSWNIIKGTFDPKKDKNILDTAIREAREEANAKIKLKNFLGVYYLLDNKNILVMFAFIANLANPVVSAPSKKTQAKFGKDEIIEVKLFTKKELLKLRRKDFVGKRGFLAVKDYISGKKFPLDIIKIFS